ncbi:anillin-like isoform X1 [Hypanus sabinus]|uniref:anillin-like isoform X1 n=1 Tax=Hypanus sabinus TaxID=79690 RepID=UPI0028C49B13|nr:anillin-like isoform X1 [Hypanus sabinus]XP_059848518.1 anillin-like isoform X1 [Hypanus sabinus]
MSSLCTVEAMLRSPLKRLRQSPADNENDPLKKQKFQSLDEEIENINPLGSKFRVCEQEIKPDTPIVPSVKSRLQRLAEQKKELCSHDTKNGLVSLEATSSWNNELARPPIKKCRKDNEDGSILCTEVKQSLISSSVFVQTVKEKFEEMTNEKQNEGQIGNHLIPAVTPSTKAIQAMLLQKSTSSASRVIWMKKERERELAILRGKTERKNAWVEKMSKSCMGREETPKDINIPEQQEEMKENKESQVNTIHDKDTTMGFENMAKSEEVLHITEDNELGLSSEEAPTSSEIIELFKDVFDTDHANEQMENKSNQMVTELENSKTEAQNNEVKSEHKAKDEKEEAELTLSSATVVPPIIKSVKSDAVAPLASLLTSLNNNLSESCCSIYSSLKLENPGQNQNPTGSISSEVDSIPFYSIDLYRSQRRGALQAERKTKEMNQNNSQGAAESSHFATKQITTKEKIKILNDEIKSLNKIMHQASQALNCCTDKEHGKGSREEAEAERLLLIASEKRVALLSELNRLKREGNATSRTEAAQPTNGPEPCRGTVSISNLRLPLKAEFVCSAQCKQGKPSQYFLLIIKCGPHNIVATPLATAEDAHQGDTIIFPTIITLGDIHYKFEIDVEVYSLAQTSNETATTAKRRSSRSKVMTPKKLLTSITNCAPQNRSPEGKSSCCILFPFQKTSVQSPGASPTVSRSIRASKFVLVGSHTITLASLGKEKFALDKMKLDGKVRQLLGDEFQNKVPFLSPLEGGIYLKLQCHFNSSVEHSGFLTIFQDVSGFGAWHRRWFVLSGDVLSYWTYPNEVKHKKPFGCINLADCTMEKIEPASREFCSRPKTLEMITTRPQSKDDCESLTVQCHNNLCFIKYWLSADTKEERNQWIEKLNQALINLRTWQQTQQSAHSDRI